MSNPFSCTNQQQQPPSYSGVTINITNPSLSIPPAMPYGNSNIQCYPTKYVKGMSDPLQKQYSEKMGLHAFAQTDMPLSQTQILQQGQNPKGYSTQDNNYGINIPYYTPYINGGGYIEPVGNNTANQNSNDFVPYQIIPSEGKELMPAYPPQYYINNLTYPKENAVNLLPQEIHYEDPALKEHQEESNTDTSKEIISELDERRTEEKELEKNGKKTKIISLTNEYIMSLENYLNNPNTDIRLMAAKEILTRLDEDRNRYDDAALNALLNKMLQDPNKLVRVAAMSAFSSELASGNDYTVQLLTQIQQNPDADPEDVLEASQILLKRAATTEIKYTDNNQQKAENIQ